MGLGLPWTCWKLAFQKSPSSKQPYVAERQQGLVVVELGSKFPTAPSPGACAATALPQGAVKACSAKPMTFSD